jgi:hypothetical protein
MAKEDTMRFQTLFAIAACAALLPIGASAQGTASRIPDAGIKPVRIQVNMTMFLPGPTDTSEQATKLREQARRSFYDMAAHECQVVEQTIANSCRLESINVNVNAGRQYGQGQVEGITVTGGFAMQVTLK